MRPSNDVAVKREMALFQVVEPAVRTPSSESVSMSTGAFATKVAMFLFPS